MDLLDIMLDRLGRGEPLAHVAILHQDGSTPRTAGARMLVFADGSIAGTIGGGQVEAMAMDMARASLGTGRAARASFDLTGGRDQGMDMICGGRLEALIEPLADPAKLLPVLRAAQACRQDRRPFTLLTMLRASEDKGGVEIARCLLAPEHAGRPELRQGACAGEPELEGVLREADREPWSLVRRPGADWLVEHYRPRETVYLFGGGHVAQKVAHVAHFAGFRIAVLDDRPEFANRELFPQAELLLTPSSFANVFELPDLAREPMGDTSYVVIVTRGHRHDADILEQTLRTAAGYIGMIGSRAKREATYRRLAEKGFGSDDFARVHCPIGLDIGAQTPEEIGVSVVAEMILHRAGGPKRG
jgi:xanthine dehydrogenase accessory factor